MDVESFRNYCLSKNGVTEHFPFDEKTLVFKVGGKMFALTDVDDFDGINLKCDPEYAITLRESYTGIEPGYHMNKTHWNTVKTNMDVNDRIIYELIDQSYELIVKSLPLKIRNGLKG